MCINAVASVQLGRLVHRFYTKNVRRYTSLS